MQHAYNWFDYVILGIFFFSVLSGLLRGAVKEIIALITWAAAFIVSTLFCEPLAASFAGDAPVSWLALSVSFIVLFLCVLIAGSIINYFVSRAMELSGPSLMNRLFGGVVGFGRGFLVNLIIIFLAQLMPNLSHATWWTKSSLIPSFESSVKWLDKIAKPEIEKIKKKMDEKLQDVDSNAEQDVSS